MGRRRAEAVDDSNITELHSGEETEGAEEPSSGEELKGPRDSRFEVRRAVKLVERALSKLDTDEQKKVLRIISELYE